MRALTGTFTEEVAGVGTFVFRHRNMRDQMRISAEYSRLTEGVLQPIPFLAQTADMLATLKVLTDEGPKGWNLDTLDPLDVDSYAQLGLVYGALSAAEDRFRPKPAKKLEAAGPEAGTEPTVLVPTDLPPVTDGPTLP